MVEFLDLYPTLCDLADLPTPKHLEGRSFAALLVDPNSKHREAACSEMKRGRFLGRSIRTADFRYVEWRDALDRAVARELYDHRNNGVHGLLKTSNVAEDPAFKEMVKLLSEQLSALVPHKANCEP